MTIKELINYLQEYPENTTVLIFDPETEDLEQITGFLYDEANETIEFCSDDVD